MSDSPITCQRLDDDKIAYCAASEILVLNAPYSKMSFGVISVTLAGQIRRGRYFLAMQDGRPVGYTGWAYVDEDKTRSWIDGGGAPSYQECLNGDAAVLMTVYAKSSAAKRALIRALRNEGKGRKVLFHRIYNGEKDRSRNNEVRVIS